MYTTQGVAEIDKFQTRQITFCKMTTFEIFLEVHYFSIRDVHVKSDITIEGMINGYSRILETGTKYREKNHTLFHDVKT